MSKDAVQPKLGENTPSEQPKMSKLWVKTGETCTDAIYRNDAINAVITGAFSAATIYGRTDKGSTALHETVRAIKALPPAEPQWIPCSERLPEYGVPVLTYDGNCYCVEKRIPYICDEHGEHLISDWWVSDDYDEADSDYYPNLRDGACIAWLPLPTYEGVME